MSEYRLRNGHVDRSDCSETEATFVTAELTHEDALIAKWNQILPRGREGLRRDFTSDHLSNWPRIRFQ